MRTKITHERHWYYPYLVYADVLEKLWLKNDFYIQNWDGLPNKDWFHPESGFFKTADVEVIVNNDKMFIHFINGRHRTRWLLQTGESLVPVAFEENNITIAEECGLVFRQANEFDEIAWNNNI